MTRRPTATPPPSLPADDGRLPDFDDPRNLITIASVRCSIAWERERQRAESKRKGEHSPPAAGPPIGSAGPGEDGR